MVMVKRSLAAANAIVAGKNVNAIASLNIGQTPLNAKAPGHGRSLSTLSCFAGLFQDARNTAEGCPEIVTEALDHSNDRNRYAGSDQAVFDCRGA
jgi:hypothetical protein